mgnify:CR=1 FL=1
MCGPSNLPDELAPFLRTGRHQEINAVFVARRPAETHREITGNADVVIVVSALHDERSIQYLVGDFGKDMQRTRTLARFEVLAHGDMLKAPECVLRRMGKQHHARRATKDADQLSLSVENV